MSYMIEIKEDKFDKMAEYTEKMLKYGGKLMSCLSEVGEEYGISFRGEGSYRGGSQGGSSYGNRYNMGYRGGSMAYREDDDDEWEREEMMAERRGRRRDSRGRYM